METRSVKNVNHLTEYLIRNGQKWITAQRERYRPESSPLSPSALASLTPFFRADTLACVRTSRVPLIENPPFYAKLHGAVLSRLMDFRNASGITFIDTIVFNEKVVGGEPHPTILFHEIVHVAQYHLLGVSEFTRRYVLGWARSGFRYREIPLEKQAFELTARFESGMPAFSVEREIESTLT